ncbi:FadD7 family fatty acid--CoA ligase [Mycolicibacterium brisbanense]|uniref:Acyl-CoA synthetase n=1 Tax=Mycolicibacterium brisbanense TaxID=146020 RepID=A0A124E0F8_9MYCO|nr:FadD7 family fatty acid--CoA ligase [Mycolicibacterium brisbanense]MCV7158552.1 AMP-binding protein [Mycolicibacterium brisbanense]GAS90395.1 acyl-CoA synthetase [Mycolicibacterium brisbanense]
MITMTGLSDVLDEQLRIAPWATALVATAERIPVSYGTLSDLVDQIVVGLRDAGLRRGDAVGLVGANTVEFVVGLLGAARAGLVTAPLDPALPAAELRDRLDRVGARALLIGSAATDQTPVDAGPGRAGMRVRVELAGPTAGTAWLEFGPASGALGDHANPGLRPEDALVLFTSGTTGQAKMVPLTHGNVAASVRGICATYDLGPDDATVAVMPLFHGHGLVAVLLGSLASGGRVLLPARGRFSAHMFWNEMRSVGATWFSAVPTIHQILLNRPAADVPGPDVLSLRFVRSCSAPLDITTARAIERAFGAPLLEAYGMTETTHQAAGEQIRARTPDELGSVGRGTGAVRLRIVDGAGNPCPPGVMGEVWVSGSTVARGYLADPVETAKSFVDGWFRTGDLGIVDVDGRLHLTGRIKNIIIRGGENISPEHVEGVLTGCDGVVEAAVFAIPDDTFGERVGAAVVLSGRRAGGPEQIALECRAKLPAFEVPERIDVVTALPHTAKGAIDRNAVKQLYAH